MLEAAMPGIGEGSKRVTQSHNGVRSIAQKPALFNAQNILAVTSLPQRIDLQFRSIAEHQSQFALSHLRGSFSIAVLAKSGARQLG